MAGGARVHSWNSGWLDGAVTVAGRQCDASRAAGCQRAAHYRLRAQEPALSLPSRHTRNLGRGQGLEQLRGDQPYSQLHHGIVENFGWPCYEGSATTAYSGSSICTLLYSQTARPTAPLLRLYHHQQKVVAGDETGVGSGAISGLAFYGSGTYPANYQGALFFSDYLRNNIWVMFKGANGLPDPANRANFLLGAASPVDLETGPGGDLFYADLNGGTIRRIKFFEPVVRSNGQPTGILPVRDFSNDHKSCHRQNATCRYATTPGIGYGSMPNTFTSPAVQPIPPL